MSAGKKKKKKSKEIIQESTIYSYILSPESSGTESETLNSASKLSLSMEDLTVKYLESTNSSCLLEPDFNNSCLL